MLRLARLWQPTSKQGGFENELWKIEIMILSWCDEDLMTIMIVKNCVFHAFEGRKWVT